MSKQIELKKGFYIKINSNTQTKMYTLYNKEDNIIKSSFNVYSFIEYIKGVVNLTKKDIKLIKEM